MSEIDDKKKNLNLLFSYILENAIQSCGIITDATVPINLSCDLFVSTKDSPISTCCVGIRAEDEVLTDEDREWFENSFEQDAIPFEYINFDLSDYIDNPISLNNIKNSSELGDTYNYLTSYINANKNNPEVLANSLSYLLSDFLKLYDHNTAHISMGNSQQEILDKILATPEGKELKGFICRTMHEFVMTALHDCGIDAAIIAGGADGANHATLLYQLEDNKYIWNNYGIKLVIEASNIKDAMAQIYKQSGWLHSGGYYHINDNSCSYQEFALTKEAAFGDKMDKRDYIKYTPFDNKPNSKNTDIQVNVGISNQRNIIAETGTSFNFDKNKRRAELSLDFEYKKTNDSPLFNNSESVGADIGYKHTHKTNRGNLFFNTSLTTAYTVGETSPISYTNQYQGAISDMEKDIIDRAAENNVKIDAESLSFDVYETYAYDSQKQEYLSTFINVGAGYSSQLKSSDNMAVSQAFQCSFLSGKTRGLNTSSYYKDSRIIAEEGINFQNRSGEFTFDNTISTGIGADLRYTGGEQKLTWQPVVKLNAVSGVEYDNSDNFKLSVQGRGYMTAGPAVKETGFEAGIFTQYRPNGSNISFWGKVNTVFENQRLTIGGFNEKTENKVGLNFSAGALINPNLSVYTGYNRNIDKLNSRENYSTFTVGCKLNF